MSAHLCAYGRLVRNPETRETKAGKPWATARLAVNMPVPYGAEDGTAEPTLWLDVKSFGEMAEVLARHAKGECLSVGGRLELRQYKARDGSDREAWTVIADSIVGPRTSRPRGGRRRTANRRDSSSSDAGAGAVADRFNTEAALKSREPFNDDLPF